MIEDQEIMAHRPFKMLPEKCLPDENQDVAMRNITRAFLLGVLCEAMDGVELGGHDGNGNIILSVTVPTAIYDSIGVIGGLGREGMLLKTEQTIR